jgi:hypothetical protein
MLLSKTTRKHLMEYNWDYAEKKDSNPSQTRSRLRNNLKTVLNELVLIADKLPEKELNEIFASKSLEPFVRSLIDPLIAQKLLDPRRTRLSAMMIEICVHFCIRQIEFFMDETPNFKEPIVSRLRESIEISNDLANKIELDELRSKGNKENLVYLFNWSEALKRDKARVDDFISRRLDLFPCGLESLTRSRYRNSLMCRIGLDGVEDGRSLEFKIDRKNETGVAILFDENHNETRRVKLMIKEGNNETYIYMKKP